MNKKSYALNVSIILGASVALLLYGFVLVSYHRGNSDRIRHERSALLTTGSSVAERIKPVGQVGVMTADVQREPVVSAAPAAQPSRNGQQVYQASCVACHGAGIAGAPKLEDKGQWAMRIAKGVNTLYASAVDGIKGSAGVMPAKGGNSALSNAEVKAAVDYMVAQSK